MKRSFICLFFLSFFIASGPSHAIEVVVEMAGAEDFVQLKGGIQKTIAARCLSANTLPGDGGTLSVSLMQLGETISFDAVLDSQPPRAFHRDVGSRGEISGVIDLMIEEILIGKARSAAAPFPAPAPREKPLVEVAAPPPVESGIELPFVATSLAVLGGTIFVSDGKTLYRMEGDRAVPYWRTPGSAKIYRIYPYQDSLLAVTNRRESFHTYRIRGSETVQSWERCVIPLGDTLVMSRLMTDLMFSDGVNYWENPVTGTGEAYEFPQGFDFVSARVADVVPSQSGLETIAFDKLGRVTLLNGKNPLWASETKLATLPLYFESKVDEPDARYYLMPRILPYKDGVITIANEQGSWKFLRNVKYYDSSRILMLDPGKSGGGERDLVTIRNHYCADIALDEGDLIVLVVKKSTSLVQRIDL